MLDGRKGKKIVKKITQRNCNFYPNIIHLKSQKKITVKLRAATDDYFHNQLVSPSFSGLFGL